MKLIYILYAVGEGNKDGEFSANSEHAREILQGVVVDYMCEMSAKIQVKTDLKYVEEINSAKTITKSVGSALSVWNLQCGLDCLGFDLISIWF